ncbi:response regulator [Pseudodesulfovibrio sp. zrk46]|uniref:response regulator n=1 Tax=Pseudodesulfovibrio sp. zrk46 TaxID=2725288 RepID=UPI001448F344|nr:response regulator [Pseudodesulfovibrio sp. zrk46]QJB57253.1 response regulator [Pseudodesulfovibrio sp. zrk46]
MKGLKVLVADDSVIIRTKIIQMLEQLGHTVVGQAENGTEAIEVFSKERPDLITMDITMPDMDGIEATRIIIDADPNANILVLTSHAQQEIVQQAIEAGAKGYVVKPVTADKLSQRIKQIMEL